MTPDLDQLTPDSDPAALRAWFEAVRLGFHQTRGSDKQFEHWLADAKADAAVMRSVPDPDDGAGMPVATLIGFDKTINAGREVIPARLISDVTVRPTHRRQGMLRTMITADLADAHERGIPVAALTVTEATIYGRFGFGVTTTANRVTVDTAHTFKLHAGAAEDHGRVRLVAPAAAIEMINDVFTEFHASTRGSVEWPHFYQDWLSGTFDHENDAPDKKTWCAVHLAPSGKVDGFASYVIGDRGPDPRAVEVQMLVACTPKARLGLWEYLASIDLTAVVKVGSAPVDDPLAWAMVDRRGYKIEAAGDRVWSRILDPVRCLSARPWRGSGSIVIEVADPMEFAAGRFRIEVAAGVAEVTITDAPADVIIPVEVLGGLWLGAAPVHQVAAAGRLAGSAEAITSLAELMDLTTPPYGVTFF